MNVAPSANARRHFSNGGYSGEVGGKSIVPTSVRLMEGCCAMDHAKIIGVTIVAIRSAFLHATIPSSSHGISARSAGSSRLKATPILRARKREAGMAAVDPNETPAVEAAPYPRPPSGCFFHSRRLSSSWPTVRHGVCRHHRVVRCELDTQMRSRAPSSVSWSTTIRCRLSSGRVRQALRVHVPITALEVRPEGTGMDVDGRR
jgi:hypothetical protein